MGIIEGLTEFLPVSSTAHLMIASKLLGVPDSDFLKTFEIVIQLGAIFAVLFLYFKKIFDFKLIKNLFFGFLPAAVLGFVFYPLFRSLLERIDLALLALFFGGIVLIVFEEFFPARGGSVSGGKEKDGSTSLTTSESLDEKKSFVIGLWQSLAMIPGVSRSLATIFGGLAQGLSKKNAVEFSFLLALPTMFFASGYDLFKNYSSMDFSNWQNLALGFFVSFLSAVLSVKLFLKFLEKNNFQAFGWYRIIFSLAVFGLLFI
ncbi:MAG: Undecaprenyl-diphosphatase [Parcubacteria group bacterium GW2011_GWC1_45_9]|nr:MAG: Undecaprenyl-diphosphatase [Parcubacteria group bacterium GW2011_GWB1_45_10]KKU16232.1 MAG: Undecaprenyl-diphosphatase [Parcubacteria group bacterium GW2011_GWC1_45_9]